MDARAADVVDALSHDARAHDATPADTTPADTGSTMSGYPSAANTGVPPGTMFTTRTSTGCNWVITTDGTVVDGVDLHGCIDVEANNVTIQNSRISSDTWWAVRYGASQSNVTGLRLLHNTILSVPGAGPDSGGYDYAIDQAGSGGMEVAFNDISGYKDGVDISSGSVHDNYIHDLSYFTGAHDQDIYVWCGGSGLTIRHNTLSTGIPTTMAGGAGATAAIYIAPDCGHQNEVTVDDNRLAGGAYALYGGDNTATNIVVTNNGFSTALYPNCGIYGTDAYWHAGNAGNVWTGNVWSDGPRAGMAAGP
jgi:hypothetical protein